MAPTEFYVKRLSDRAKLPVRGSTLAAGWDLASAESVVVPAKGKALVKTNLAIAIPEDCYARIAPRSGLAAKKAIDVGAGVVDADYRGDVGVILFNHGGADFEVRQGDRIAQCVVMHYPVCSSKVRRRLILEKVHLDATVKEVQQLPDTARGSAGFGSTGLSADPSTKKLRVISPTPRDDLAAQVADLQSKYADLQAKYDTILARVGDAAKGTNASR